VKVVLRAEAPCFEGREDGRDSDGELSIMVEQEGLTMNTCRSYLGLRIHWPLESEEMVQVMGIGY